MAVNEEFVRSVVQHPPPPIPLPAKISENDELDNLSSMMDKFTWSADAVEECARVLLQDYNCQQSAQMSSNITVEMKVKALQQLKQLLCTSREQVFRAAQDIIDTGVLSALVSYMSPPSSSNPLCLPATFCLTNVAAGLDEQTASVVEAGAIGPCVEMLRCSSESLRRQAIFCLANIAGSTPEFRRRLSENRDYFSSIVHAVNSSKDPKIAELAGWNMRNMCVLGGPAWPDLKIAILFFAHKLAEAAGSMSMVHGRGCSGNTDVVFGYGHHYRSALSSGQHSLPVLRFASETFSWISRNAEGVKEIEREGLIFPLLCLSKLSANHAVRNHCLEALCNSMQYGSHVTRRLFDMPGGVSTLAELMADAITFTPQQRVLAGRTLFYYCIGGQEMAIRAMSAPLNLANLTVPTVVMIQNTVCTLEGSKWLFDDDEEENAPPPTSPIQVALTIFEQNEGLEEFTLREKCGRIIIGTLAHLPEDSIKQFLTNHLIKLILEILEFAAHVDGITAHECNGTKRGANAIEVMNPGEVELPPGQFTDSIVNLIHRMLRIGEDIKHENNALDNPIALLFGQAGVIEKLQNAVTNASNMPYDIIQKTSYLIQKYCLGAL